MNEKIDDLANRRDSDRVPIAADVDYKNYSEYHLRISARLANISKGGVFITSEQLHPVGTQMKLSFNLPDSSKKIEATAEVKWIYRQPGGGEHNSSGMGVEFTEIAENDRLAILKFIEGISTSS